MKHPIALYMYSLTLLMLNLYMLVCTNSIQATWWQSSRKRIYLQRIVSFPWRVEKVSQKLEVLFKLGKCEQVFGVHICKIMSKNSQMFRGIVSESIGPISDNQTLSMISTTK